MCSFPQKLNDKTRLLQASSQKQKTVAFLDHLTYDNHFVDHFKNFNYKLDLIRLMFFCLLYTLIIKYIHIHKLLNI